MINVLKVVWEKTNTVLILLSQKWLGLWFTNTNIELLDTEQRPVWIFSSLVQPFLSADKKGNNCSVCLWLNSTQTPKI